MAKSSGGGGRGGGGVSSSNTGSWINFKDGRRRVGVRFDSAVTEGGRTVNPYSINIQQASRRLLSSGGYYEQSTGEFYNSLADVRAGRPSSRTTSIGIDAGRYIARAARR
jgi:hypothetical protein